MYSTAWSTGMIPAILKNAACRIVLVATQAKLACDLLAVDDIESDVLVGQRLLHSIRQTTFNLVTPPVGGQQKASAVLEIAHQVVPADVGLVVACHEVGLLDQR